MDTVRCKEFGNCPCNLDDGADHQVESFAKHECPLREQGACGLVEVSSSVGIIARFKAALDGIPAPARLAAIAVVALLLVGVVVYAGYPNLKRWGGASCEVSELRTLMATDPKQLELEEAGTDCFEAGMAAADIDQIAAGTVALRQAAKAGSAKAAWLLGRMLDPLKRAELEEELDVPSLLPSPDIRAALAFYDEAAPRNEDAKAAAAALRARYPELRVNAAGENGAPLSMVGHSGLYQRVLTKPGATLSGSPGAAGGQPLDTLSLLYVFEARSGWLRVGESLNYGPSGWVKADTVEPWNVMLVMRYTPPANRGPVLFFRDQLALKSLLMQPDAADQMRAMVASADSGTPDPRLAAIENKTIDWSTTPYMMPILATDQAQTDAGRTVTLAQIASVAGIGGGAQVAGAAAPTYCADKTKENLVHQIAFVIDTTASMGPYIEGVRRISRQWQSEVTRRGLTDKFRFGVVAYRNNMDEEPQRSGLEYVTRAALPLGPQSDVGQFAATMDSLSPARVSTHSFDEDAAAGLEEAMRFDWSQGCGVKFIFLVTDAGSLRSDDPKARNRELGLSSIAADARERDITIFPVHVLTREARAAGNIEAAAQQYRTDLADGRGTNTYRSIADGSPGGFATYLRDVGVIIDDIDKERRGVMAQAPKPPAPNGGQQSIRELVLGKLFSAQQRFLGATAGATAPTFAPSWTSDRDLANPDSSALEVSIFLTRQQLGQLAEKCRILIDNARQAKTQSGRFFDMLRMVSAATAQDPQRFATSGADLKSLMPSFLSLLPYKSEVLALSADQWRGMGASKQDAFVRRLSEKLRFYRMVEGDSSRWRSLGKNDDKAEQVALIALRDMP